MKIYCIGLGAKNGDISLRGYNLFKTCGAIVSRTDKTAASEVLKDFAHICLDSVYETARDFDELNTALAGEVLKAAKGHKITAYCVPGSGAEDNSVAELKKLAKNVEIIPAAGYAYTAPCDLGAKGYVSAPAYALTPRTVNTSLPLIVYEIDNGCLAADVKLILSGAYGDTAEILLNGASATVADIDRLKKYDYSVTVAVPPVSLIRKQRFDFADLMELLSVLRSPQGCPWDREQTHSSIRNDCIEEAYEVADAIDSGDTEQLEEEAGDLLLQAAFHAQIAADGEEFTAADMITGLCQKLIYRHRHVFGDAAAKTGADALKTWESQKDAKKNFSSIAADMQNIPKSFPQTLRALKAQKKARKASYDFADISAAAEKLREELEELKAALGSGVFADVEEEAGDCLFALINVLRFAGVDPELALNRSVDKFIKRFALVEEAAKERGLSLKDMTAEEIDGLYVMIKTKN